MIGTEEQWGKSQRNSYLQKELTSYVCLALQEVFSVLYQEMSVLVILIEAKFLKSIIPP